MAARTRSRKDYLRVTREIAEELNGTPARRPKRKKKTRQEWADYAKNHPRLPPTETVLPRGRNGGRPKGSPNKFPRLLKDAILAAAEIAGNNLPLEKCDKQGEARSGLEKYLAYQSIHQPAAYIALLGRVLPLQVENNNDGPLLVVDRVEYHVVDGRNPDGIVLEHELNSGVIAVNGPSKVSAT